MLNFQNLKCLQCLFDSFMHDRKKSQYNTRSRKFAYPDLKYYFRWITESEHGVSNIADEVKVRIRRIPNPPTINLASQAITDLQEQDRYRDKLKSWFEDILAFDHFSLFQNEFQSQFYWLICIYTCSHYKRSRYYKRTINHLSLTIFSYQINKSCSITALHIQCDKCYSNAMSCAN